MSPLIAVCHGDGCSCAEVPITVDPTLLADGSPLLCGCCGEAITDITPIDDTAGA